MYLCTSKGAQYAVDIIALAGTYEWLTKLFLLIISFKNHTFTVEQMSPKRTQMRKNVLLK